MECIRRQQNPHQVGCYDYSFIVKTTTVKLTGRTKFSTDCGGLATFVVRLFTGESSKSFDSPLELFLSDLADAGLSPFLLFLSPFGENLQGKQY